MQAPKNFRVGQMLNAVWYNNSEEGYRVGHDDILSIEVVMEPGQMAAVPWALITFKSNRRPTKLNLALCNEVVI